MKIIYPGVKRDRDGKFTESKLILVEPAEFIGRKMPVSDKPRDEFLRTRTKERHDPSAVANYVEFRW